MADKNVRIEVLDAVVDGQGKGAVLVVEAKSAQHLANIGYVRILGEAKPEISEAKTLTKRTTK